MAARLNGKRVCQRGMSAGMGGRFSLKMIPRGPRLPTGKRGHTGQQCLIRFASVSNRFASCRRQFVAATHARYLQHDVVVTLATFARERFCWAALRRYRTGRSARTCTRVLLREYHLRAWRCAQRRREERLRPAFRTLFDAALAAGEIHDHVTGGQFSRCGSHTVHVG
jgi:hypothetical protein